MSSSAFLHHINTHKCRGPYQRIVPLLKRPTRIKLVGLDDFQQLDGVFIKHEEFSFVFGTEVGSLEEERNKGVLLCAISPDPSLADIKSKVDFSTIELLHEVYGNGLKRKKCDHSGLATYRCSRKTSRPHPRPSIADEDIPHHQYFSEQQSFDLAQPFTEQLIKTLGSKALSFGKMEHPQLYRLINDSCDKAILTSGLPKISKRRRPNSVSMNMIENRQNFFSFSCARHVDTCDMLKGDLDDEFQSTCTTDYEKELAALVGSGMPTTCQYFHVWKDAEKKNLYEIRSYFIHHGIGLSHELMDDNGATFLGFAYAHSTSFCYLRDKLSDIIYLKNDPNIFSMLAWGQTGGHREYKLRNKQT